MSLTVYLDTPTCPHCGQAPVALYARNTTHNLIPMAEEAGIYKACWRPEEIGITKASQLIEPLTVAIATMRADRPRFEKFNAKNGWGLYIRFLPWLEDYLAACKANPTASVSACR